MAKSPAPIAENRSLWAFRVSVILQTSSSEPRPTTISLGLSHWKSGDTVDTLIQRADKALYLAKAGGRNRIEVVD